MRIKYYIDSKDRALVLEGTPAKLDSGDMTLMFETVHTVQAIYVNRKKYAVSGGVALIPAERVSSYNDITVQCTTKDGAIKMIAAEALIERDGYLIGISEHTGHYLELKQCVVALTKLCEAQGAKLSALEKKCSRLEYKLEGTDIFDLEE